MKPCPFIKKTYVKVLSVIPALLLLSFIFGFSAQTGEDSGSLSFHLSLFLVRLFSPIFPAADTNELLIARAEAIHLLIRKLAHITEFFLLMLSIYLPIHTFRKNTSSFYGRIVLCFCLSVLCAFFDEFHQSFVDGRSGNLPDVLIDSIGILLASILLILSYHNKGKRAAR